MMAGTATDRGRLAATGGENAEHDRGTSCHSDLSSRHDSGEVRRLIVTMVMTEKPGRQRDRGEQRFQVARRPPTYAASSLGMRIRL